MATNIFYRREMHNLIAEKALGKRIVSFGESGGFVKGKSEFPLRKVQGPERAENRGYQAEKDNSEIALH